MINQRLENCPRDGNGDFVISVYGGERMLVKHNHLLGSFTLENDGSGNIVEIVVEIDSDGIVCVTATVCFFSFSFFWLAIILFLFVC